MKGHEIRAIGQVAIDSREQGYVEARQHGQRTHSITAAHAVGLRQICERLVAMNVSWRGEVAPDATAEQLAAYAKFNFEGLAAQVERLQHDASIMLRRGKIADFDAEVPF